MWVYFFVLRPTSRRGQTWIFDSRTHRHFHVHQIPPTSLSIATISKVLINRSQIKLDKRVIAVGLQFFVVLSRKCPCTAPRVSLGAPDFKFQHVAPDLAPTLLSDSIITPTCAAAQYLPRCRVLVAWFLGLAFLPHFYSPLASSFPYSSSFLSHHSHISSSLGSHLEAFLSSSPARV
ncbi:hypothetical protein FPOAC1_003611 [Fusarium poae]|uniref:hypothetical protein n=1 Tax=Fusarium poae TaxID=36050 RepID=UPI001CEB546C|nr:hypothetical protein FPOAC1_003611 [Fusarium poae]KAG8677587.1 hypothetical protein FPOAC1_003611 [Fusarium poae]